MTTPKEAIQEILAKLDNTVDTNWTDDGSPSISVIRKLANDATITRAQINDASPGFVRMVGDAASAPATAPAVEAAIAKPIEDDLTSADPLSDDQMRVILSRRVRDAELNLTEAQTRAAEATAEVAQCQKRLQRAHLDHNRRFPPITAAANIKAHLAAQGRLAEQNAGLLPIEAALQRSSRRGSGQGRPSRPVNNVTNAA
jgi:hypothetical protein